MSAPFKVGDVVIGQHFTVNLERNGMEAVVTSPVKFGLLTNPRGEREVTHKCQIRWADGLTEWQKTRKLRLRKPPQSDSNERMYMDLWRDMADKAPQREGVPA